LIDIRAYKFAQIIIDYSTKVKPGDTVAITATTAAEPVVKALYELILERGGHPHVLIDFPGQKEIHIAHGNDKQIEFIPLSHKMAFEEFDLLIKIRSEANTREFSTMDPERVTQFHNTLAQLITTQMKRGAEGSLRWMSTLYPTNAYAMEAEMGFEEYKDFVYRACHADVDTVDPVAYWQGVQRDQQRIVDRIEGGNIVELRGPNVDLRLSIKDRKFRNASAQHNLPDGEIYTGPVEESVHGWVRYTYPAVYQGRIVEGIEFRFEDGKVVEASAERNQDFLLQMLDTDPGARYLGEFAIGTNFEIDRFTRNILFDEKIGGSFHTAVGAGYPETGSRNKSIIHWDMICDLRDDSEILVDGEVVYQNGYFIL
jgi:aminopeptidase